MTAQPRNGYGRKSLFERVPPDLSHLPFSFPSMERHLSPHPNRAVRRVRFASPTGGSAAPAYGDARVLELHRSPGQTCQHLPVWLGAIAVSACADCAQITWFSNNGPIDPTEAIAKLFGNFDLVDVVDALRAPSPRVLVYQAPSARRRAHLQAFPEHVWLKAAPGLWLSHDRTHLLLAPSDPLLLENLSRRL